MEKHEWRKHEKHFYAPKTKPEVIDIPAFKYITISGEGNPNQPQFGEHIGALYAVAYPIKMNLKKSAQPPKNYRDFTVYPLEGVWDISEKGRKNYSGTINKDDLVFTIMIRQPDFVTDEFFQEMLQFAKNKNANSLLHKVKFETITDGQCIQMLHKGSFDSEPASFKMMEEFASAQGLVRQSKIHREIYLSDFRRVKEDKLKTILRFKV